MATINDMQRIATEMKTLETASRIPKELHSMGLAQQMQGREMNEALSRLGITNHTREAMAALDYGRSAREAMAALDFGRSAREAMKALEISEQFRNAWTVSDLIGQRMRETVEQMQRTLNASEIIGRQMFEARKAFEISDDTRRAFAGFNTGNQIREAMKGFDISSHMRGAFEFPNSAKQIQEAMTGFEATRKLQETLGNHTSPFQALTQANVFEGINNVLKSVSPDNWPAIYENEDEVSVTDNGTLKIAQRYFTPTELEQVVETIIERVGSDSVERVEFQLSRLIDEVKKVKEPALQKFFATYIFPLIVMLLTMLVTFYGNRYLENLEKINANEKRVLKKAISNEAVAIIGRENLVDYRFVVAATLNVRVKSSSKAAVVGTLHFGQTVQLIERHDSWSRIRWTASGDDSEAALEGWVFSRYLEKFR